jgi:hypothetical protein
MGTVTVAIAAISCVLALIVRPGLAAAILVASMLLWPDFMRIPFGPALMSCSRFVALTLVTRWIFSGRISQQDLCTVDLLVIANWVWLIAAKVFSGSPSATISQAVGSGLDTAIIYLAVRFAFRSKEDLFDFSRWLSIVTLITGGIALVEMLTNTSPYRALMHYRSWDTIFAEVPDEKRLGLFRARVSDSVHIYFGLTSMMIAGILAAAHQTYRSNLVQKFGLVGAYIGNFASLSTGPWIAGISNILIARLRFRPRLIKPIINAALLILVLAHILSNRGVHYLVSYTALSGSTAWYRSRLIDVAIEHLNEYWLFGYGARSMAHWGREIDGRAYVDVVNQYILVASSSGVLGMLLFIGISIYALKRTVRAWKLQEESNAQHLLFILASTLVSANIAIMAVNMYGTSIKVYFILVATIVAASDPRVFKQIAAPTFASTSKLLQAKTF